MSQNISLKFKGLWTAGSDIEGLPPGSCLVADNVESRYTNLAECRNGFSSYAVSATPDGGSIIRTTDFYVLGIRTQIVLTSLGNLYYQASGAWVALPGLNSSIVAPNTTNAKSRFIRMGQNLYVTSAGGILSMCSGSGSNMIHAGVQKGLDLVATSLNTQTGFLTNNPITTLTGVSVGPGWRGYANLGIIYGLTSVTDLSGLAVGQYVSAGEQAAFLNTYINYVAGSPGTDGNAITIAYTAGGTAGSEVVSLVGTAISVKIQSGVSTTNQVFAALQAFPGIFGPTLLSQENTVISGNGLNVEVAFGPSNLANGINGIFPLGTTITEIIPLETTASTTGTLVAGDPVIRSPISPSIAVTGLEVSGNGIVAGSTILSQGTDSIFTVTAANATAGAVYDGGGVSFTVQTTIAGGVTLTTIGGNGIPAATGTLIKISGSGDATITWTAVTSKWRFTMDNNATISATLEAIVFSSPPTIVTSQVPIGTYTNITAYFYLGSQVMYQMVFGRVETDINGNTITRLGSPSTVATLYNNWNTNTNVSVTGTIPKNCSASLTFVQLYRSATSPLITTPPLQQFQLVYERVLVAGDFTARVITVTDDVLDVQRGASLYTGVDQEGATQANNPPPFAWDITAFKTFVLFGNCRQPSTLPFSILAVGPSSGVQVGDTITLVANATGVYTASTSEVLASRNFHIYITGTPAQNIENTTRSLIRVINYDQSVFVHAVYVLNGIGLPSIVLEADYPILSAFTATASAHATAYSPTLTSVSSSLNITINGMYVSKEGELEAVPAFNTYPVGDSSSPVYRVTSSSSTYAYAIKSDGIYQVSGYTPATLSLTTFDETTRIIGADTVVSLNSQIWMFSNQGVVAISDSGVNGQSQLSIQNIFDELTQANLAAIQTAAFAIGYESDKKYLLCLPSGNISYSDVQYGFNYVTNCWTTWSRNIQFGYINQSLDLMYICRADSTNTTLSYENKTGSFTDFSDESFAVTITVVSGTLITLSSISGITEGDILYQTSDLYSTIVSIDTDAVTVTVVDTLAFTVAAATIYPGITCTITWKEVIADNPAMTKNFSEGLALFKDDNFYIGYIDVQTDFSNDGISIPIYGDTGGDRWGLFDWGTEPWDGDDYAENIRFFVTPNEQFASYIQPTLEIHQAFSPWTLQGLSITFDDESSEVGK